MEKEVMSSMPQKPDPYKNYEACLTSFEKGFLEKQKSGMSLHDYVVFGIDPIIASSLNSEQEKEWAQKAKSELISKYSHSSN